MAKYLPQEKISRLWSPQLAYGIGLLVSDGNLSQDGRHFSFVSAEEEMVINFKKALGIDNKIGKNRRGGETEKRYYTVYFSDTRFHHWLGERGVGPAKSKTIQQVMVPDIFFC